MDLEEQGGVEKVGERCEECGAELTAREMEQVLEAGGPVLCTIHAQERLDDVVEADAGGEPAA